MLVAVAVLAFLMGTKLPREEEQLGKWESNIPANPEQSSLEKQWQLLFAYDGNYCKEELDEE